MATQGNNISAENAKMREEALASFDEHYLSVLTGKEKPKMAIEYFLSKKYKENMAKNETRSLHDILEDIGNLHFLIENGEVSEDTMPSAECAMIALFKSIEDCQMVQVQELERQL